MVSVIHYLLTESEVITGQSQTEALMYWPSDSEVNTLRARVWDFPVMTEPDEVNKLFITMAFLALFLKKNTIKTPEVIFLIRLRTLRLSSSLILKNYLYASFSFSCWKYNCTLSTFSVVFAHVRIVLLTTQKSRRAEKTFHNARSLQENNARSAANQSARTIVAI